MGWQPFAPNQGPQTPLALATQITSVDPKWWPVWQGIRKFGFGVYVAGFSGSRMMQEVTRLAPDASTPFSDSNLAEGQTYSDTGLAGPYLRSGFQNGSFSGGKKANLYSKDKLTFFASVYGHGNADFVEGIALRFKSNVGENIAVGWDDGSLRWYFKWSVSGVDDLIESSAFDYRNVGGGVVNMGCRLEDSMVDLFVNGDIAASGVASNNGPNLRTTSNDSVSFRIGRRTGLFIWAVITDTFDDQLMRAWTLDPFGPVTPVLTPAELFPPPPPVEVGVDVGFAAGALEGAQALRFADVGRGVSHALDMLARRDAAAYAGFVAQLGAQMSAILRGAAPSGRTIGVPGAGTVRLVRDGRTIRITGN